MLNLEWVFLCGHRGDLRIAGYQGIKNIRREIDLYCRDCAAGYAAAG